MRSSPSSFASKFDPLTGPVFLGIGVGSTLIAGALFYLGEKLGVAWVKPSVEALIALILILVYPERAMRRDSPWVLIKLLFAGAGLGLSWVAIFAVGRTNFPDISSVGRDVLLLSLASSVITAPIFEEKVVRYFLLRGLARWIGSFLGAVLVSTIFAFAHGGAMLWSFCFSILMCWAALGMGVGTLHRSLIHGAHNAVVMAWYFTAGFGLFG